jgi:hypothetical protein
MSGKWARMLLWRQAMVRGRRRTRKQAPEGFYGRCMVEADVGGRSRGEEEDAAELVRRFRELLYKQPAEVGLLLRGSRVLVRERKGSRKEELARRMEATLEGLGEQFLPRDG